MFELSYIFYAIKQKQKCPNFRFLRSCRRCRCLGLHLTHFLARWPQPTKCIYTFSSAWTRKHIKQNRFESHQRREWNETKHAEAIEVNFLILLSLSLSFHSHIAISDDDHILYFLFKLYFLPSDTRVSSSFDVSLVFFRLARHSNEILFAYSFTLSQSFVEHKASLKMYEMKMRTTHGEDNGDSSLKIVRDFI